jgi:hypothetical protein
MEFDAAGTVTLSYKSEFSEAGTDPQLTLPRRVAGGACLVSELSCLNCYLGSGIATRVAQSTSLPARRLSHQDAHAQADAAPARSGIDRNADNL